MKKKSNKNKRTDKKIKIAVLSLFLLFFIIFASFTVYYTVGGYAMYREAFDGRDVFAEIDEIRSRENYIKLEDLPKLYTEGVVAVEDINFYKHNGLDYIFIIRALLYNIKEMSIVAGGSTITQQLAKNLYFTNERTMQRKVAEVFAVRVLESHYTKDEILELYVNIIDFGDGYTGVLEASRGYYQKEPCDLTPYECASLIGIPNNPKYYSPTAENSLCKDKTEVIIGKLKECSIWPKE